MNPLAITLEFIGTFIFLFVIVASGNPLMIGLTLTLLIYIIGSISGGHFNPAVTIMTLWRRAMPADNAIAYMIAQILGAIAAGVAWQRISLR